MSESRYLVDLSSSGTSWVLRCFDAEGVEVQGGVFPHDDDGHADAVSEGETFLASNPPAVPVKRGRGRPRVHASPAARQAAYIASRGIQISVVLPVDLVDALHDYMTRHQADGQGLTQSEVIAKLLRTQLLRKR